MRIEYERALQYSGDQIGIYLCKHISSSVDAFYTQFITSKFSSYIRLTGLLIQSNELHLNFFGWFSKLYSRTPHLTDRYLNILSFIRYKYPEEFKLYLDQFDNVTDSAVVSLLPR